MESTSDYIELTSISHVEQEDSTNQMEYLKEEITSYISNAKCLPIPSSYITISKELGTIFISSSTKLYSYTLSTGTLTSLSPSLPSSSKISLSSDATTLVFKSHNHIIKYNLNTQQEDILYEGDIIDFKMIDPDVVYILSNRAIRAYNLSGGEIKTYSLKSRILNFTIDTQHSYLYIQTARKLKKLDLRNNNIQWSIYSPSGDKVKLEIYSQMLYKYYKNTCWVYDSCGNLIQQIEIDDDICSIVVLNSTQDLSIWSYCGMVYMYDASNYILKFKVRVSNERVRRVLSELGYIFIITDKEIKVWNLYSNYTEIVHIPKGIIQKVVMGYQNKLIITTHKQTFFKLPEQECLEIHNIHGEVYAIVEGNCVLIEKRHGELMFDSVEMNRIRLEGDVEYIVKNKQGSKIFLYNTLNYLHVIECRNWTVAHSRKLGIRYDYINLSNEESRLIAITNFHSVSIIRVEDLNTIEDIPITFSVKVACMNSNLIITGGYDGDINIIDLSNRIITPITQAHDSTITSIISYSSYIITSSSDKTLKFWCLQSHSCIAELYFPHAVIQVLSDLEVSSLYVVTSYSIYKVLNPIQTTKLLAYPMEYSMFYMMYCKNMLEGCQEYYRYFNKFTLFPMQVNAMNVMIYSKNMRGIKECVNDNISYIGGKNTPIRICLRDNTDEAMEIVLRYMLECSKKQPKILKDLEDILPQLTHRNLQALTDIYDNISIPAYLCIPNTFSLNLSPKDSIPLLSSLLHTSNSNLLLTNLSRSLLFRFSQARKYYLFLFLLSFLNASAITESLLFPSTILSTIFLLLTNSIFLILSLIKLYSIPTHKYCNFTWIIEIIKIVLQYIYLLKEYDPEDDLDAVLGAGLIGLVWIECVYSLRVFDGIRRTLSIILKILEDIIPIFFIGTVVTFSFAFIFYILGDRNEVKLLDSFLHVYKMNLGSFDTDTYTDLQWGFFIISSLITPILLLNLLIAFMSNSYSLHTSPTTDIASKLQMIYELQISLFWLNKF